MLYLGEILPDVDDEVQEAFRKLIPACEGRKSLENCTSMPEDASANL